MSTVVISGKPMVKFVCSHCHAVFKTDEWRKTKKGHSAECPVCKLYSCWSK